MTSSWFLLIFSYHNDVRSNKHQILSLIHDFHSVFHGRKYNSVPVRRHPCSVWPAVLSLKLTHTVLRRVQLFPLASLYPIPTPLHLMSIFHCLGPSKGPVQDRALWNILYLDNSQPMPSSAGNHKHRLKIFLFSKSSGPALFNGIGVVFRHKAVGTLCWPLVFM